MSEAACFKNEYLAPLFARTENNHDHSYSYGIIGGGLSGCLLALRLSRDKEAVRQGIALWEKMPNLGGRVFFGGFTQERRTDLYADFLARFERAKTAQGSGFGFEMYPFETLQILERHIKASLTEEEEVFFDDYFTSKSSSQQRNLYVVKKEITKFADVLSSPSEFLTKKEAEIFAGFLDAKKRGNQTSDKAGGKDIKFKETTEWKALTNAQRDDLSPLLETIIGKQALEYSQSIVYELLSQFVYSGSTEMPLLFARNSHLEAVMEIILRSRGVFVNPYHRIHKVNVEKNAFAVGIANGFLRQEVNAKATKLVLAAPLISSLSYLPRNCYGAYQVKNTMKYQPQSLVAVEYSNVEHACMENFLPYFTSESRFMFPTERILGMVNATKNILFYTFLDYEESFEAPVVREIVNRVRKAAARIFKPESLSGLSSKVVETNVLQERVVLVPVARYLFEPHLAITETKMQAKNLYCCGDAFTLADYSVNNSIESAMAVHSALVNEG